MSQLEFDASDLRVFMMERGQSQEVSVLSVWTQSMPYGKDPEGFHWGKDIVSATQTGNTIDLKFLKAKNISSIYLGDEAMAKRVIYAINYLRIECDPAANTGF
ncbi:MAG TPA: hypothetical protein VN047_09155 [Sphingopyxis sp.]|uniref:hypothetical protein n=1 Tax=Sphingopyxis sp. TaxID=1908224 RepID=UPI002BA4B4EB|nr:hypothetical protein [Sphingopyxis sp.]HWW57047.1 hypothetical protein [Sphingopyxis sp.]